MYLIGLDIGGTKCASILGKETEGEPTILSRVEFKTFTNARECIVKLCDNVKEQAAALNIPLSEFKAAGISCGGPLSSKLGLILSPPNLIGWDKVPVVEIVSDNLGLAAYLQNDADAGALAEWKYGAGKGADNVVFLTFGTGLGAGLILNGALYCGASNMAGELGHIRLSENGPVGYGKRGSFEGFCSGNGIAQLGQTMIREVLQNGQSTVLAKSEEDIKGVTAKDISLAAAGGDGCAINILAECGRYFGKGLSILVDLLNPQVIIAGGVYMRAHEFIDTAMYAELNREALNSSVSAVKIVPSKLGERIGDIAALTIASYGSGK